jgi:indolepyruvate ferredoxin oxidoreductase
VLRKFRRLRGTALDPFGYSAERRAERRLVAEYEALVGEIVASLDARRHRLAVELASLPEGIRGFGHVKARTIAEAKRKQDELLAQWRAPGPEERIAA